MGCPKARAKDRPRCAVRRDDESETPSLGNVTCASEEQVVDARDFLRVVTTGSRRGSDDAIGADELPTRRGLWRGDPDRCRPDGAARVKLTNISSLAAAGFSGDETGLH